MKTVVLTLLLLLLTQLGYSQTFTIDSKGIVKCPTAKVGDRSTINGIAYEAVDRNMLLQRIELGVDLTRVCTSLITDMSGIFLNKDFNQPIGNWDVSNVTSMSEMFRGSKFNQPIGNWDVSRVTDMSGLFSGSDFNKPIESWNVSKVRSMSSMFSDTPFNQPLENWDVSSVIVMSSMFRRSQFDQPINKWNTSSLVNITGMFRESVFNHPIGDWNVSNVLDMASLFVYAKKFNHPLTEWCVIKIPETPLNFTYESALEWKNFPIWGTCPGLPEKVKLDSPVNQLSNIFIRPTFTWNSQTNSTKYNLQIFQAPAGPVVFDQLVSGTTFTISNSLKSSTEYYWRVRGYNESKKLYGDWSPSWIFRTQSIPTTTLSFPSNGSTNLTGSVDLVWAPTVNTASYHIQVSGSSSFSPLFFENTNVTTNAVKLPSFVGGNPVTFYWRVRSKLDSGEAGDWSDVWSFTRAKLTSNDDSKESPYQYSLDQNFPNPFNPTTNISFSLPTTVPVRLEILSILGQPVSILVNQTMSRGNHTITFDGSSLSSGVYLYRLTTPEFTQTRVMSLVK